MSAMFEINYADDWSGECRMDPDYGGNTYVLRAIESYKDGYMVQINDIFGGHVMHLDLDEWLKWPRVAADAVGGEQ